MSNTGPEILVAGTVAAFTIDLLVYPLDTIKTRYQSQDYIKTFARAGSAKKLPPNLFRGLYQGIGSVILTTLPAAGTFFTTYESAKPLYSGLLSRLPLPDGLGVPTAVVHSLASGTAELASCLVLTPAEVIKQNAQMIRSSSSASSGGSSGAGGWRNSTSMQALRMISRSEGGAARRLLTGYSALVARNLPFTAMQFPMFEALRHGLWDRRDGKKKSGAAAGQGKIATVKDGSGGVGGGERRLASGAMTRGLLETLCVNGTSAAVSGAVAAVITTPTDVVKTRMMLSAGETNEHQQGAKAGTSEGRAKPAATRSTGRDDMTKRLEESGKRQRLSAWQVAKLTYAERDVRGLFRGGLLRAGWTALGSGLYLGTYEVAKVWLKGSNGNNGSNGPDEGGDDSL